MTLKVAVLGLTSNKNIGDYLLVESTKYLLRNYSETLRIKDVDVDPRDLKDYQGLAFLGLKIHSAMRKAESAVFKLVKSPYLRYLYQYAYWYFRLNSHFKKTLTGVDAIIFSGGGFIKFKTQGLNYLDEQILKIARKRQIPVMMNAVGVEGYDENDVRCQNLKKALNFENVRVITTRDDVDTLAGHYVNRENLVTARVADPVLYLNAMLGNPTNKAKNVVGINLINPENFRSYGGRLDVNSVTNFYKNLIVELRKRGQAFELFSNGMAADMRFGEKLIEDLNLPKELLLPAPTTSKEFIELLRRYRIILASRMHAGISASAIGIPVVGMIWGEKIEMFSKIANVRKYYFDESELDAKNMAELLSGGKVLPLREKDVQQLKESTKEYLFAFLDGLSK
jgi:polysaccharide pyruvyl transferase WcaK-like protein